MLELNFDFAKGLKDDAYFYKFLDIGKALMGLDIGKKRFVLQVKLDDSIIKPQRKDGKMLKWDDVVDIIMGYKKMKDSGEWELEICSCCGKETINFIGNKEKEEETDEEEPVLDLD